MLSYLARRLAAALPARLLRWLGRAQFKFPALRWVSRRLASRLIAGESTIRHGPARGMRINPGGAHPGYALGTSEPFLQQALVELLSPGDVFYDLGANVGFFTLLAARLVGRTGTVIAFEPDPRNAEALRSNSLNGLANVGVIELGVSDQVCTRRFAITESTASHLANGTADEETIVIEVINLDGFASDAEHRPRPPSSKSTLRERRSMPFVAPSSWMARHRPVIICVVHGTETDVRQLLQNAGYRLRRLDDGDDMAWNAHILALPGEPSAD
jgi:FkbM family methyltransferase